MENQIALRMKEHDEVKANLSATQEVPPSHPVSFDFEYCCSCLLCVDVQNWDKTTALYDQNVKSASAIQSNVDEIREALSSTKDDIQSSLSLLETTTTEVTEVHPCTLSYISLPSFLS